MRRVAVGGFFVALAAMSACGGDDTTTTVDTTTINGQVLQGTVPAVGAIVYPYDRAQILAASGDASVLPAPSPVIADGSGHFTIYGFGTLYDLTVAPANAPLTLTSVRGLTQRAPIVRLPAAADAPSYSCHIGMSWSAPPPEGATILYFLQGPAYPGVELISVKQTDANYLDGVDASWRGSYSTSAQLWVVAYMQDAKTGLPTAWNGSAVATVELVNARETSFFTVLQAATASPLDIDIPAVSGYSVDSADVVLDFGSGTSATIAHFDSAAAATLPLVVSVPDLPGNRLIVRGVAHDGVSISNGTSPLGAATPNETLKLSLEFATAAQLTPPTDAATQVDAATSFAWQGGGLNLLSFSSTAPNAPSLTVVTSETAIPFGELLGNTGAQFPAGASMTWSTRRYPGHPNDNPPSILTTDVWSQSTFDISLWASATSAPQTFTVASP
jgi:hypothetical protein